MNIKGTVTFRSLAPTNKDRAILTLSRTLLSSLGHIYFNIACIICVPVTVWPAFKGIASLERAEAPGWKHPLAGWLTGLIEGAFMNGTDKIPPLTCVFSELDSLLFVDD